jgi:ElaB/YqjD/DUF883 family membrane-anchored ribosome-binding protein
MNKETQAIRDDLIRLAEDAQTLMAVTADSAGDKVVEARKRLAATLDKAKQAYGRVRDRAVDSARTADAAVREHPYEAIVISLGIGALVGLLMNSIRPPKRDRLDSNDQ